MPDSVLYRVGLSLAVAGRPGARRRAVMEPGLEPLPAGWEDAAQAEMEAARRLGIAILVPDDPRFPPLLREVPDPPQVLYVRGSLEPDDRLTVAVVGARRSTPWGAQTARRLGQDLAALGFTVASGMARGIDAAAHRGALAVQGGRTLAVLGSGLDRVYPPEHARLAESIAKHGALLSELPLGTPPLPRHFPERNRLIAWMAWATVVVEAAKDSGSLITAGLAADAGRLVFAMPGPAGEPNAAGTSALLRDGAICCRDARDVAEDLGPQVGGVAARIVAGRDAASEGGTRIVDGGDGDAMARGETERGETRASDLPPMSDAERRVLEHLSPARGTGIETLAAGCGLPAGALMSALLELELRGLVRQVPGPRFIVSRPRQEPE
jgi:DNA processing protein